MQPPQLRFCLFVLIARKRCESRAQPRLELLYRVAV